jgi:hypothetical protein
MVMLTKEASLTISPRAGNLLTQVAETADLETALWKVLSDYIDLKIQALRDEISQFESRWNMSFSEFSEKFGEGSLPVDSYTYEVESEFWNWEKAETLLQHYEALQA